MLRRHYRILLSRALIGLLVVAVASVGSLLFVTMQLSGEAVRDTNEVERSFPDEPLVASFNDDPLSRKGYTQVDISILPGKMVVAKNCTGIVMTTTVQKTYSIERGVEKKLDVRPDEHDLIADILDSYAIEPIDVRISRFAADVYYAEILLRKENDVLSLDAKPSDALAVASRFKIPALMKTELLNRYGSDVCKKQA